MPVDWSKYPSNWKWLVQQVRTRSGGRCECTGECDLEHWDNDLDTGEPVLGRCQASHGNPHPVTGFKVVLTTAHLDHDTTRNDPTNLKAMCQRCHLRLDRHQHAESARRTREARSGQMRLAID